MTQTVPLYDNALKEFYEGAIRETVNNSVVAYKFLEETSRPWAGRHVTFPIHTGKNAGVGARAENTALPTAGRQSHLIARITAAYNYGRIALTGPVMKAGKHAFADAMEIEMDGVTKDLTSDLGRQTWGVGDGRLAQVGAAAASATAITVFNKYQTGGCQQPGARYLFQGQSIDGGTVAAPTTDFSSQTITSINLSQNPGTTVDTLSVATSALNGSQCESFLFNRGAGGVGVEMMGIQGLVDVYTEANIWGSNAFAGSAIQNVNRAANNEYDSIILGNSGTARIIDGNLMQQAFDQISIATNKDPDFIWGHHDSIRAFLESVAGDRRYSTPEFNIGGTSKLSYEGVPLIKDRQAPYCTLLVGLREGLKMYTLSDLSFSDEDGSILKYVNGFDTYEAFLKCYKNIGLDDDPKKLLFIRDIQTQF